MGNIANDPNALNEVLENILIGLLDQAQNQYEDRSGKRIRIRSSQKLKLDLAKKVVQIAFDRIGSDNAEKKFKLIVKLTNEHLPYVVNTFGEDVIVNRIEQMPEDVRDQDVIEALELAGADELAGLLRKAMPELEVSVEAETAEVSDDVQADEDENETAEAQYEQEYVTPLEGEAQYEEETDLAEPPAISIRGETLESLTKQRELMKQFRRIADASIDQLDAAIEDLKESERFDYDGYSRDRRPGRHRVLDM